MTKINLNFNQIYELTEKVMISNGCNKVNAEAVADIILRAEIDGSDSHGLFRLPGYLKSLRSGKVNGKAKPIIIQKTNCVLILDGNYGFAPYSLKIGLPKLASLAQKSGIAILSLTNIHHFAALWPETEYLAAKELIGIACTSYMPVVAPAGSKEKFFGTNPLSFAFPIPEKSPICFDMATSSMSLGDLQIALNENKKVPFGTGLDQKGNLSNDPSEIIKGVLLPFGGYKGSAIALMVELLSGGLTGDYFSYEAKLNDNGDGGPSKGGEIIIAISPSIISGKNWKYHVLDFYKKIKKLKGLRLPGERRYKNRLNKKEKLIDKKLYDEILKFL